MSGSEETIQLVRAEASDRKLLDNWMALYLHDLSEFASSIPMDEDGLFRYEELGWFFERDGLMPYLIKRQGAPVGFVLLQSGPYVLPELTDYAIHSFFILRRYRSQGVGKAAALQLFRQLPGRYVCGQLQRNAAAVRFWRGVYEAAAVRLTWEREFEQDGEPCVEQYFRVAAG